MATRFAPKKQNRARARADSSSAPASAAEGTWVHESAHRITQGGKPRFPAFPEYVLEKRNQLVQWVFAITGWDMQGTRWKKYTTWLRTTRHFGRRKRKSTDLVKNCPQ